MVTVHLQLHENNLSSQLFQWGLRLWEVCSHHLPNTLNSTPWILLKKGTLEQSCIQACSISESDLIWFIRIIISNLWFMNLTCKKKSITSISRTYFEFITQCISYTASLMCPQRKNRADTSEICKAGCSAERGLPLPQLHTKPALHWNRKTQVHSADNNEIFLS